MFERSPFPAFSTLSTIAITGTIGVAMLGAGCIPTLAENPPRDARSVLPDAFPSSTAPSKDPAALAPEEAPAGSVPAPVSDGEHADGDPTEDDLVDGDGDDGDGHTPTDTGGSSAATSNKREENVSRDAVSDDPVSHDAVSGDATPSNAGSIAVSPPTVKEEPTTQVTTIAHHDGKNLGQTDWPAYFASPELRALIEEAVDNNQELNIQLQELMIAKTEVDASFGELFPKVSAGLGAGIEKVGSDTSQGVSDRHTGVAEHLPDFAFGLRASWEVDIWGKLRDATSAADARFRASVEARNFVVTQLVAELARSYYELVALDAQLEILERNITIQKNALEVVKVQKQAAKVTQLAVQRFEAEVLKNRARLFDLRQQRVVTENRINFLVGRPPQAVTRDAAALAAPLPEVLQAGVPAELLDNRPDIRAATLQLEAAKLDVGVARANFYPALSIDTELGYRSFNILHLINTPESLAYNLAGNLAAPILNRPAIEAQYRSANAKQLQAVFHYERTVLQAFTDVANQLVKFENLQQSYDLGSKQVATLQASIEMSNVLFRSARADYMEVLLTRRDALDAELELIETRERVWQSTVDLYQALGGGWRGTAKPGSQGTTTTTATTATTSTPKTASAATSKP